MSDGQLATGFYFTSAVYSIDKPEFLDVLNPVCEEYLSKQRAQNKHELYPLYQTESINFDPRLNDFCNFVGTTGWNILLSQGYQMAGLSAVFNEMWCQEHYKHSGMDEHIHGGSAQLVGFYFLETPENCSVPTIHDPRPGKKQINLPEADMALVTHASNAVTFAPKPGLLLFASSWLPHSFTRHGNDKPIKFIHFTIAVQPTLVPPVEVV